MYTLEPIALVALLALGVVLCGCSGDDGGGGEWDIGMQYTLSTPFTSFRLLNSSDGNSSTYFSTYLGYVRYEGQWKRYCLYRIRATLTAALEDGTISTLTADFSMLPGLLGLLTGMGRAEMTNCLAADCTTWRDCIVSVRRASAL